jgi:histidine triad (HIT) family protein
MAFIVPVFVRAGYIWGRPSSRVQSARPFLKNRPERYLQPSLLTQFSRLVMTSSSSEADTAKRASELRGPEGIFSKILAKQIPADIVYEDEECLAFRDINPQAPKHVVVIPKRRIAMLSDAKDTDALLLGKLMLAAAEVARIEKLDAGYRVLGEFLTGFYSSLQPKICWTAYRFAVLSADLNRKGISPNSNESFCSMRGSVVRDSKFYQLTVNDCALRLVVNDGYDGLQSVGHLHLHVVGGRKLKWGPF